VKWHRAFNGLMAGAALLLPLTAVPESRIESGTASTASSAMAHVNFKIVIPQVLYLRVGPGNDGVAGTQTVAIMSNGRNVTLNSTDRAPDSNAPARRNVILNASARKSIAQEAQCTPSPAPTGIICTVSMP
jgi:hypothetical protein